MYPETALTDKATQCLTSFSLAFGRTNSDPAGLDMSVSSVTVSGRPARFAFEQPTYPGDPNGPGDLKRTRQWCPAGAA